MMLNLKKSRCIDLALILATASLVTSLSSDNRIEPNSSATTATTTEHPPVASFIYDQTTAKNDSNSKSIDANYTLTTLTIGPNIQITTTVATPTKRAPDTSASDCNSVCSVEEYAIILQRITQESDVLRGFKEASDLVAGKTTKSSFDKIRPVCVRELIDLIKSLATNELELKNLLEFASDNNHEDDYDVQPGDEEEAESDSPSRGRKLFPDSLAKNSTTKAQKSMISLDLSQIRWLQTGSSSNMNRSCHRDDGLATNSSGLANVNSVNLADESIGTEPVDKTRALPRLVAKVDNWINALERFTVTREWASLLKVFQGTESILGMFVNATTSQQQKPKLRSQSRIALTTTPEPASANTSLVANRRPVVQSTKTDQLLDELRTNLPSQVLTLTNSLNNLFPWHVWPWNNLDLYTTVDTFLNHGIFAFSKTTLGPERRIDYFSNMLKTLFTSLNYENFPKKCADWSKIICNPETFYDRLVISPLNSENADSVALLERAELAKRMSSNNSNQLTQELTCIMFSSLSMKQFGATQDFETDNSANPANLGLSTKLPWDKQILKAIKLYTLSREALTDEQWLSIYNLINELWSQQKITNRVVMVGRIVQLLTNCHMPKEMLESALWKDIYKYKNVLNQLIDIVIEELNRSSENGKLTIDQIALGSRSFHEILERFIKILPNLIESLSQTVVDQLPELVNKFFNEKAAFFKAPCKGHSFSDIIPTLAKYREQIVELEKLVCQQIKTKPNITMMQINNLINNFLSMAFNFSNIGNALAFPKLLTDSDSPRAAQMMASDQPSMLVNTSSKEVVNSIVDEMAANPRLAQVVAILQSSVLDPPEVHAELPELDWVEAGTSIALLYDSIQKLLSYEEAFRIFPEIDGFQEEIKSKVEGSKQMFKKFSKRDPIRLVAYSLDAVMPIALRTYKPMESFNAECVSSFKDIFSEDIETKATKQWQCVVSSMNFGAWALNKFLGTFNDMFKNILTQMTSESAGRKLANSRSLLQRQLANDTNGSQMNTTSTCILFDGSLSVMLDDLPQFIDLALETVLMASTSSDQQMKLYDIMCSSNYMLDPFNERSIELKARMKYRMCHLFHKSSLTNCAGVLKVHQWASTMKELNSTWFESNSLALAPSFREITLNLHEFLELFGQFKPSTMSDSLLARVLNFNSFWANSLNRIMNIMEKYQEKRFEYALQTLTPIIYDNLPTTTMDQDEFETTTSMPINRTSIQQTESDSANKELRETLITTILGARAILQYLLDKQHETNSTKVQFEAQIKSLFNWADQYMLVGAESMLRTIANNITKLEMLVSPESLSRSGKRLSLAEIWQRFCSSSIDTFLVVEGNNEESPVNHLANLQKGQDVICKFEWESFYEQLGADSNKVLSDYPERQLTRIALTKWGQVLDVMFIESKNIKQLPKFFYMDYWQEFSQKLPQITPLKEQPSNLIWIWAGFEKVMNAMDAGTNQTSSSLIRILDQLNCGLDAVKGGLSWENIANIYSDKQDILAAHSTINNGFALVSIGVNTFLTQKKFQKFLNEFVKPKVGIAAFCEMRDRNQLQSIFSVPRGDDFLNALESFQELVCDTNFEALAQDINPISVCYQTAARQSTTNQSYPLAENMDRFFKLASLAVLDAKLVAQSESKPPILDKRRWSVFWNWREGNQNLAQPKSSIALAVVRVFQTIDSINSNHVVWKALFKSVHELSEIVAYLTRAVEKRSQEVDMIGAASRLSLVREAASQIDSAIRSSGKQIQQQQLASTLSNIMFPEVNNFISYRTFKQLRYIRLVSEFFVDTTDAQESVCRQHRDPGQGSGLPGNRIELIGYRLNSNEKLFALLCHYQPSQWLTALNIVISSQTTSVPSKVNLMTKYLSIFSKSYKDTDSLEIYMHGEQLENIESVANTTVSHLMAASQSLKTLSFSKFSNISWHSLPNLLDSIDRHLCASKFEQGTFHIPQYEPKKPELETIICKLPQWNITQVYDYLSENFDLQNMISLIKQHSTDSNISIAMPPGQEPSATLMGSVRGVSSPTPSSSNNGTDTTKALEPRTCVTPFKFASRWLKIGQEIVDEAMSKASRDRIRKCIASSRKGQSLYSESLRYIKILNSILSTIDDLTQTNSWFTVKKTWNSISYLILDQSHL